MVAVTCIEAVAGLAALAYLGFTARAPNALRSLLKTAAVALLAGAALATGAPFWLVVGLGACALGDYCLSRSGETMFMAGVGAFAMGHLAYVALFLGDDSAVLRQIWTLPGLGLTSVLVLLGVGMAAILAPVAGQLRGAVLGYIPIILAMGVAALTLTDPGLVWVLPAALAFVASDVALAFETFVLSPQHQLRRVLPYVVWPLYWGAQAGFYLSFS